MRFHCKRLVVALAIWLAACGEDSCTKCAGNKFLCESVPQASSSAIRYQFTVADVAAMAEGTWSGRYPGGDVVGATDVSIKATSREGAPEFGTYNLTTNSTNDTEEEDITTAENTCGFITAPAKVVLDATNDDLDVTFQSIHWPVTKDPALDLSAEHVYADVARTVDGERVIIGLVLATDGSLWLSVTRDGEPLSYKQSGARE